MVVKTANQILKLLTEVQDPEIPVLNIVEMGIVREVNIVNEICSIDITPTYTGCPAMKTIEDEIRKALSLNGIEKVAVNKVYSPAWTTDWLSEKTKRKLKTYGIAPPEKKSESHFLNDLTTKPAACPYCNSKNTKLTNEFSSTA